MMEREMVIQAEHISKKYRLGSLGASSFWKDLLLAWTRSGVRNASPENNTLWALKDVNFEIYRGEVLGIIGKNGAGKSTLLKILSQITQPDTGEIRIRGRVASLLEVGTGFHPELTGRENVFLNGLILGMSKKEVRSKFDEIVAFSGVEQFIDTPVKRYSSGMKVRLGFAVAAHLDPEILVVDEVLAVGDAEFQRKCIGKMQDVSVNQGRTVLFVSHNMTAVNSLCSRVIYLKDGQIVADGPTAEVINTYLSQESMSRSEARWNPGENPGDDVAVLHSARLIDANRRSVSFALMDQKFGIEFTYELKQGGYAPIPNIHFSTTKGDYLFVSADNRSTETCTARGYYTSTMWIPPDLLNTGTYQVRIAVSTVTPLVKVHCDVKEALIFDIIEDETKRILGRRGAVPGLIRPQLEWMTLPTEK